LWLTKSATLKINTKHLASFGIKIYLDQAMFSSACLKYGMEQTTLWHDAAALWHEPNRP
jgi:hypothetical protein